MEKFNIIIGIYLPVPMANQILTNLRQIFVNTNKQDNTVSTPDKPEGTEDIVSPLLFNPMPYSIPLVYCRNIYLETIQLITDELKRIMSEIDKFQFEMNFKIIHKEESDHVSRPVFEFLRTQKSIISSWLSSLLILTSEHNPQPFLQLRYKISTRFEHAGIQFSELSKEVEIPVALFDKRQYDFICKSLSNISPPVLFRGEPEGIAILKVEENKEKFNNKDSLLCEKISLFSRIMFNWKKGE